MARALACECLPGLPVRGWAGPQGVRTLCVSLTPSLRCSRIVVSKDLGNRVECAVNTPATPMEEASTPRNILVYLGERNSKQNSRSPADVQCCVSFRVQQRFRRVCVCVLFQIFPHRFLQCIACGFLCCRVSPCCVSVLYSGVCLLFPIS